MISETVSHYHVLRPLDAGGMGEVYLAEDLKLGRKVAIKFLSPALVADEQAKRRLLREAQAAALLDHPNICPVYEVGEEDSQSYIVMQYVEGDTLSKRIQNGPLKFEEILDLATQVVSALCEAHSHGIIHRDIKPQNIIITPRGQAKVLDFGLAKMVPDKRSPAIDLPTQLTLDGMIIGTVPYMSPEQLKSETLDGRSDIFSFGTMLYEMVTGVQPFKADTPVEMISAILGKEPPPLSDHRKKEPLELESIVSKALSKNRESRYQTAEDLLKDLNDRKQRLLLHKLIKRNRTTSYLLWGVAGGAIIGGLASVVSVLMGTSLLWKYHVTYMAFRVIFEGAQGGIFFGGLAYFGYALVFNKYEPKLTRRRLVLAETIAGCLSATVIALSIFFLFVGQFGPAITFSAAVGYWLVPALGGVAMGFALNLQPSQAEPETLLRLLTRATLSFTLSAVVTLSVIHFFKSYIFSAEYLKRFELADAASETIRCTLGSIGLAVFHWWLKWRQKL